MSDISAIVGFGVLVGSIVFAAFRAATDVKTRADVDAQVRANGFVSEAKVRALEAEIQAMKRIAAAEAVALERIKAAGRDGGGDLSAEPDRRALQGGLPALPTGSGSPDPGLTPDPDQDGIDDKHVRMMDGLVYPRSDFQS